MKKWTIPFAVAATALLALASRAAWAGQGGDVHSRLARMLHGAELSPDGVAAHLDAVATTLDLSAEQRKQTAGVLMQALPDLEARALEVAAAHADLFKRVHSADLDEAAIRTASVRAGAAQAELAVAAARLLRDVHAVMMPEQLARLGDLHAQGRIEGFADHVRGVGRGAKAWAERQ